MSHIIHKILKDPLEVIKKLSIDELEEVINKGCQSLNLTLSDPLKKFL
jgi:hypothetical protein